MIKRFKRGLSLVIALVMVSFLVIGCGSKTETNKDVAEKTSEPAKTEVKEDKKDDVKKEDVKLVLWHLWAEETREDSWGNTIKNWAKDYEQKNPNVKIEVVGNVNRDKLLTAITGGQGPDIFLNQWPNIPSWSDVGGLADLTDYINNDAQFDKNDIMKGAWGVGTYKGRTYGIPFASFSSYIYYNKDILKEAGYEAPPETIEEFTELAIKLTKTDKSGKVTRLGYMPDYPWLDNVLWPVMCGASWIDFNTNKITFDTPEMKTAYQWQVDIYKKFGVNALQNFKSGFGNDAQNPFLNGSLAMFFRGESFVNSVVQYAPNMNYGIAPCPYPAGHPELKNEMMYTANVWNINNKSQYKDEAWKALADLTSKEHMAKIATNLYGGGHLLSRISSLNAVQEDAKMPEKLREMAKIMATSNVRSFPMLPYINEYLTAINDEMTKALRLEQPLEDGMKKVAEKVQKLADEKPINK